MVMSSTALMPVEEYLRLTEKPYCEYRDGAVSPKAMPTKFHAIIQYALLMLLRAQGVPALPDLTVGISPTRYPCRTSPLQATFLARTRPALL